MSLPSNTDIKEITADTPFTGPRAEAKQAWFDAIKALSENKDFEKVVVEEGVSAVHDSLTKPIPMLVNFDDDESPDLAQRFPLLAPAMEAIAAENTPDIVGADDNLDVDDPIMAIKLASIGATIHRHESPEGEFVSIDMGEYYL